MSEHYEYSVAPDRNQYTLHTGGMGFYRALFAIGQCESADAQVSVSGRIPAIQCTIILSSVSTHWYLQGPQFPSQLAVKLHGNFSCDAHHCVLLGQCTGNHHLTRYWNDRVTVVQSLTHNVHTWAFHTTVLLNSIISVFTV